MYLNQLNFGKPDDNICFKRFYMKNENNITNQNNEIVNTEKQNKNVLPIKKGFISSIISLFLAIIPYLLFIYCLIVFGGSGDESGDGAIW